MIFKDEFVFEGVMSESEFCHWRTITEGMVIRDEFVAVSAMSRSERWRYYDLIRPLLRYNPDPEEETFEMSSCDHVERRNESLRLFEIEYEKHIRLWLDCDDDA